MSNVTRIAELLRELDVDWAVLTGPDSVCFASGHIVPIEIGPSPFAGGPTLCLVGRDGSLGLVCPNTDAGQNGTWSEEHYAGFACAVTDQHGHYRAAVQTMVKRLGVSGRLAIEPISFAHTLHDLLPEQRISISPALDRLRAVKTEEEIEKLRFSAGLAAAGQDTVRAASQAGARELEVFGLARARMEMLANDRCALAGEYITGIDRSSTMGLTPANLVMKSHDPVLCDLAPRAKGYWGDSCNAFVIGGGATDAYVTMFNAVKSTLDLAIAELRPGLSVGAFDGLLRQHLEALGYRYPHHSGHGIGTSVHEFPRLVPDEPALIEQNMVLMVEPGSYVPEIGGIRCEFMLRVTANGAEVLAPFHMGLSEPTIA